MEPQAIESKVESLESRVTQLEQQVGPTDSTESQVVPLRTEMRAEFSAVRSEMAEQGKLLRGDIAEVRRDLTGLATQMRVLHEDVIGRIALLQEGPASPRRRSRKK